MGRSGRFSTLTGLPRRLITLLFWHVGGEDLLIEQKIGAPLLLRSGCDNIIKPVEHVPKLKVRARIVQV